MKPGPHPSTAGHIQKTALATLIGLITWAGFTQMDEAVSASGLVVTPARMQIVQSPDGGIVAELKVSEGQTIRRGELLAVLEKQRASAATEDLQAQRAALHLAALRAQAEADSVRPVADATATRHAILWATQLALFDQHQKALQNDIDAFDRAIALAEQEQRIMERLQASGDISPTELMRSERGLIELRQRRESITSTARTEARREVAKLRAELASLDKRILERKDVLQRTDLFAPIDGTVHSIRLKTPGAVLRPGDELLQITPQDDPHQVELRVNPTDISRLHVGMKGSVKLDAWDYSIYGSLRGTVSDISPDTVTEQGYPQAQTFYRVLLDVSNDPVNHKLDISHLKPGMRASADILAGQRSVLWYLTNPVTRAFRGAMQER